MLYFSSDYLEGCHPAILDKLQETNLDQTPGYGHDVWCDLARERIREAVGKPDAAVHFLTGGTQANFAVIRSVLRSCVRKPITSCAERKSGSVTISISGTPQRL